MKMSEEQFSNPVEVIDAQDVITLWRERLIKIILRGGAIFGFLGWLNSLISDIQTQDWRDLLIVSVAYFALVTIAIFKVPYLVQAYGALLVVFGLYMNSLTASGIRGDARPFLTTFVLMALMLLGLRVGIIAFSLSAISLIAVGWGVLNGRLTLQVVLDQLEANTWIDSVVVVLLLTFVLGIGLFTFLQEIASASKREREAMEQVYEERALLAQRVEDRTRALETSTEVSRRLSTILDPQQLVSEVVEQLRSAFGYYHAHIYLYDVARRNLEMVGGTGDAGRAMLARGHKIKKGRGLVGRAAETNEIVLIPDVSQETSWLPNPLLPETKAEVAVPIAIGPEVLGVLDVQHNVIGGLAKQDADLIQAIANQVGIALQNAQAYERAQRQAVREARIAAINQRVQTATTIDDVLKIAVSELGQALGAHRSSVDLRVSAPVEMGTARGVTHAE
jgi:putative methionine-R-sulfoxide reductase with GAF domain